MKNNPIRRRMVSFLLGVSGLLATGALCQVPLGYRFVRTDQAPSRAFYDPNHQRFFVAVPANNEVVAVAEADGSVIGKVNVPDAWDMDLSPDGSRLYVSTLSLDGFFVVDPQSLQVLDFVQPAPAPLRGGGYFDGWYPDPVTVPAILAAMRNGQIFYMGFDRDSTEQAIFAYDPATGVSTRRTPPGELALEAIIRKSADGSRFVAVSNMSDGKIWVYDGTSDSYTASIVTGEYHGTVAISRDGTRIVVDGHLLFDQNLQQIADLQWPAPLSPGRVSGEPAFSPDGSKLYTFGAPANANTPAVAVWRAADGAFLGLVNAAGSGGSGGICVGANGAAILPGVYGFVEMNLSTTTPGLGIAQWAASASPQVGSATNPAVTTITSVAYNSSSDRLANTTVFFGNKPALSVSPTCGLPGCQLAAQPPPAATPGPTDVVVGFPDGSAAFGPEAYSYGPYVLYWDVTTGDSQGGTTVNLYGYFGYDILRGGIQAQVTVGGANAEVTQEGYYSASFPSYEFRATDYITFKTPPGQPGLADVTLTTAAGSTTLRNWFKYISRRTVPGLVPAQMLLDEPRGRMYVADSASGNVMAVNLGTLAVSALMTVPGGPATRLAMTPEGGRLLVLSEQAQTLTVFDLNAGAILRSFYPVPGNQLTPFAPNSVVATSNGTALVGLWDYVASNSGVLYEVDLQTGQATIVRFGDNFDGRWHLLMAPSADGSLIYVAPDASEPGGGIAADSGYIRLWNSALHGGTYIKHYGGDVVGLYTTAAADRVLANSPIWAKTSTMTYSGNLSVVSETGPENVAYAITNQYLPRTGRALHYSGGLLYAPNNIGVEIYDAGRGTVLLTIAVPGGVTNATDGVVVDHAGATVYVCESAGIGVYSLGRAPFSVGAITPSHGDASGGYAVSLLGTGFQQGATLTIDGQQVPAQLADSTMLTFRMPSVSATKVGLTLTNPDGASYSLAASFDASPVTGPTPVIDKMAVANSYVSNCFTVSGSGFVPRTQLLLDGQPVQTFFVSSQELLTCFTSVTPVGGFPLAAISATNGTLETTSRAVFLPPPDAPILDFPADGARGVPLIPVLRYSSNSSASGVLAEAFDTYFGTSTPPPLLEANTHAMNPPEPLTANTTYYWRVVARNMSGVSASPVWSFTTGPAAVAMGFVPVAPCRVVDTRSPHGSFGGPALAARGVRSFAIPESGCSIPATAQAYSVNVTVVPRGRLSYLTLWPAGQTQPLVSTLNSWDGDVVANAAIVPAGTNGAISVYVTDTTDFILDINGYFEPADIWSATPTPDRFFLPVTPCRVVDTRNSAGTFGGPSLSANQSRDFPVPSSSCQVPATASAYSTNVTVVPNGPLAFLSVWPAGQQWPDVSTLNSWKGKVVANAAIVPAGSGGAVSTMATNTTDFILDINGYFAAYDGQSVVPFRFYPILPCRAADTRLDDGPFGGPIMEAQETRRFSLTESECYVPPTAAAYSLNITVVPEGRLSYLSAWPWNGARPNVSTLNSWDGSVVANAAIVPANEFGIAVYVTDRTHLILDVNGYFAY